MPEVLILLAGVALAAGLVVPPLRRGPDGAPARDDERDAAALRHRVALEALRDVETDRRAGSLDDAAYAAQLAEAEARAASTRAALEDGPRPPSIPTPARGRRWAMLAAGIVAAVLLIGTVVPATGIGNRTVVNEALANAQDAEAARQARIIELQAALGEDPANARALSDLADAHLAGSTSDDLVRAAVALQLLIELEPERADAYERIMTAYLRAGDNDNARAAHDAYAALGSADPVELAFFDGLIALREDQPDRAREAFDRFLELAPEDPRAGMVRGLRDEASAAD